MTVKSQIRSLIGENLFTLRGKTFRVTSMSGNTIRFEANGQDRNGQLLPYETVIEHVRQGGRINGPGDIRRLHPSDFNASYEFAVLRRLGIVS